ncbi:uncharacterized protein LOC132271240 [Cornus florida]|uniref:uncharacterized protein LOC132271240 n=1 Tax=Cornus florida TaxID=4283 RepID=UPI0028964091|nr:uncharacterized protein LOC132271240 [Cornus florida]
MGRLGFGVKCISSVRFWMLVNGATSGFFGSSRGLRQGDHLSPFLFTIVMEALSKLMRRAMDLGFIRGFRVGRDSYEIEVSHLLFADDTLVLCDADVSQIRYLRCLLVCFQAVSGLKVIRKSSLVPVGEVHNIDELAAVLGCGISSFPISYLDLPLGSPSRRVGGWDPVVERYEKRLAEWKKQYLSTGGKVTLMKSTLASLPTYFLSLFQIPATMAERIERLIA